MKNACMPYLLLLINNIIHAQNDCTAVRRRTLFLSKTATDRYTEYMENAIGA